MIRGISSRESESILQKEKPEERNNIVTRSMDEAIKGFQRDMGLNVDGVMKPARV